MESYHSCFFVQVNSDWSDTVGQHRYEEDKYLDDGDPVGEVGPVVSRVASQFPLAGALRHPASQSLFSHHLPQKAHSVFPSTMK